LDAKLRKKMQKTKQNYGCCDLVTPILFLSDYRINKWMLLVSQGTNVLAESTVSPLADF